MSQYQLYAHKNSYAMCTHVMLEELGVDYNITWFNVHKEAEFPTDFVELNPNARVPVLITASGPVYETAATLMVLSEAHGDSFMPARNTRERELALQSLMYLMSTLQPEVLVQFNAERYFPNDLAMQGAIKKASLGELEIIWKAIDDSIGDGPYLAGDEYSICDMLFVLQALWKENQPRNFAECHQIIRLMELVFERPAVQRILKIHDIQRLTDLTS